MALFAPAEILTLHALVLMICGALAFFESGMVESARSAMYVGNGGAVISFLLAAGVRDMKLKKGDSGYKLMMICVHLAIVYPIILGGAVGWRLSLAWNNPAKAYLKPFFSVIVGMCAITAGVIISAKPKKEVGGEKKDEGADSKESIAEGSSAARRPAATTATMRKKR